MPLAGLPLDSFTSMGAAADCELIIRGFLGQPVNSLTTLAFLVFGLALVGRPRLRWVGIASIATGVGSFLFHGPMPAGAEWAHDVSLAWLILVVGGLGSRFETWSRLPGLGALALGFALAPGLADPIAVTLAVIAVAIIIRADRSASTLIPLALLGVVAILGRLGATGGPLCVPESLWQWHGLWHVASAAVVAWWSLGWLGRNEAL